MRTSFQRAIVHFSKHDQATIESVLRRWSATSVGATVAPNLRDREHFLPSRFMVQILKVIRDCVDLPIQELETRYQKKCYRTQRRGGAARVSDRFPTILGCAIDRDLFIDHLITSSEGLIPTEGLALEFIHELIKSGAKHLLSQKKIFMKAYTTWVTWNEDDSSRDPFSFVIYRFADEVRASLGLDERLRGPLLIFRYEKPVQLSLHRPTVADAELFKYFAPPILSHKEYGYSRPWERLALRVGEGLVEIDAAPRPEAVHSPVDLNSITFQVREFL